MENQEMVMEDQEMVMEESWKYILSSLWERFSGTESMEEQGDG